MSKYCSKCMTGANDSDKFCSSCGGKLKDSRPKCECGADIFGCDNYCSQCGIEIPDKYRIVKRGLRCIKE